MKTKYFLVLISLLMSFATFSSCEEFIGEEVSNQIELLTSPECIKPNTNSELSEALRLPVDKASSNLKRKKICQPCIEKSILKKPDESAVQIRFTKQMLSEARKNLSKTMLDLMSVRAFNMEIEPAEAVQSCDFNKYEDQIKSCITQNKIPDEVRKELLNGLKLMKDQTRLEFYNLSQILDQKQGSLLPRDERSCSVSDKEILLMKTSLLEEELFKSLKNFNEKDLSDSNFTADFIKAANNTKLNYEEIKDHPILKKYLNDATSFKRFLSSTKNLPDIDSFRNEIYKKENGKEFGLEISNRCKSTFETMKSSFCSPNFASGNLFFDDADSIRSTAKIKIDNLPAKHEEKNQALIYFCQEFLNSNDKTIRMSEVQKIINPDLNDRFSAYEDFSSSLFSNKIGSQAFEICAIESGKKDCSVPSYYCSLHAQWKQSLVKKPKLGSVNDKSSDDINKILRSLLGNPDRKEFNDPKMITLLEHEGMIKTESGTYTSNLPTPRSENNSGNAQAANTNSAPSESTNAKAPTASSTKPKQQPSAQTQVSAGYSSPSTTTAPVVADTNPEYESEQAIREDLQKKILDRLNNQISAKQIEDMVAKAYNKGRANPLTPQQVTEKTKEILEEMPNELPVNYGAGPAASSGQASVGRDKEKEKKAQQQLSFLKAKYGIDPNSSAKVAGGKAAATSSDALKVVTINGAEELKIVVDDIKNIKGQEIAKLIETETPFILKIGKVSYKVSFENKKVSISTPEGMIRNPAAITKLEEYISSLANRSIEDPLSKRENRRLYKNLQKVKYKE